MEQIKFQSILCLIVAQVVDLYSKNEKIDEIKATDIFYNSELYELLEKEETGMWHYSPMMLYSLLKEELTTGEITFPEEV